MACRHPYGIDFRKTGSDRPDFLKVQSRQLYISCSIAETQARIARHHEQLTELEQVEVSFPVSTGNGVSRIKGLGWANG